jgi:hypothetical protein
MEAGSGTTSPSILKSSMEKILTPPVPTRLKATRISIDSPDSRDTPSERFVTVEVLPEVVLLPVEVPPYATEF